MNQDGITVSNYEAEEVSIRISSDSPSWAASLSSYLSLPPGDSSKNTNAVNLSLFETGLEKLEELIPLPSEKYLSAERTLLVNRPVPYRIYEEKGQRWIDYKGLGRSWIDRSSNQAQSVRLKESGIFPVYADIIFGYNLLLAQLAKYGYLSAHASCIQVGGQGVLFTGKSGSGKSTSAYAMLRRGHHILCDDRILLKKKADSYSALSISDVIKLGREALQAFFPEMYAVKPLHHVGQDYYYKVTATDNLLYLNSTKINYLMIFERTGTTRSRLEKVKPSRVVGELFPVTMGDFEPAAMEKKFIFLMDLLENIQCYRVYFGTDMDHFASCIENLVEAGSAHA